MVGPPGAQLYATGSDRALYDYYRDLGLTPEAAKQHVELRRSLRQQQATAEPAPSADLGPVGAARIGMGQGLAGSAGAIGLGTLGGMALGPPGAVAGGLLGAFGGGALTKPLTELFADAPAADVKQQWEATTTAHPGWQLAGELTGGLASGYGSAKAAKIVDEMAIRSARRRILQRAVKEGTLRAKDIAAAEVAGTGPTAKELAVARKYNVPVEQIRGRLGSEAVAAPRAPVPEAPTPRPPPDPLEVAPMLRGKPVARSYPELRKLLAQGVKPDVGYYTRGGELHQDLLPHPTPSTPTVPLGQATALNRSDPVAVAKWLHDQALLAQALGQPVNPAQLANLLKGFDPAMLPRIQAELGLLQGGTLLGPPGLTP